MDDFYDLLEVSEDATQSDIKRAWRGKAREYHPDVNDDDRANVQFKTLRKAYEVLSDETERAAYDRLGHADYVDQRLDGLPTAGMTRPDDNAAGGTRWRTDASSSNGRSGASGRGESNRTRRPGGSSDDASSRAAAGSSGTSSSSSGAGERTASGAASDSGSSARSSRGRTASTGSASNSTGTASNSTGTASNGRSSRSRSTGSAAHADGPSSATAESAETAGRDPLWYGWVATFLAGVAYLGGLAAYLDANADALSSFASAVGSTPTAAVLADHGLVAPGTFAVEAVAAAPGPALAFPAGAAVLAVVFLAVVGKFGHGTAYLYLLGALAPLASLALGPVVSVPAAGPTLALVVLLPVLATTLFLADVGRFLAADA